MIATWREREPMKRDRDRIDRKKLEDKQNNWVGGYLFVCCFKCVYAHVSAYMRANVCASVCACVCICVVILFSISTVYMYNVHLYMSRFQRQFRKYFLMVMGFFTFPLRRLQLKTFSFIYNAISEVWKTTSIRIRISTVIGTNNKTTKHRRKKMRNTRTRTTSTSTSASTSKRRRRGVWKTPNGKTSSLALCLNAQWLKPLSPNQNMNAVNNGNAKKLIASFHFIVVVENDCVVMMAPAEIGVRIAECCNIYIGVGCSQCMYALKSRWLCIFFLSFSFSLFLFPSATTADIAYIHIWLSWPLPLRSLVVIA